MQHAIRHRRIGLLLALLAIVAAAFVVPGCAKDTTSRIEQYADQLTVIRNSMVRAWDAGHLKPEDWQRYRMIDREALGLIATARDAEAAGRPVGQDIVAAIERRLIEAAQLRPPELKPATQKAELSTATLALLAAAIMETVAAARRAGRDTLTQDEITRIRQAEAFSELAAQRVDAEAQAAIDARRHQG